MYAAVMLALAGGAGSVRSSADSEMVQWDSGSTHPAPPHSGEWEASRQSGVSSSSGSSAATGQWASGVSSRSASSAAGSRSKEEASWQSGVSSRSGSSAGTGQLASGVSSRSASSASGSRSKESAASRSSSRSDSSAAGARSGAPAHGNVVLDRSMMKGSVEPLWAGDPTSSHLARGVTTETVMSSKTGEPLPIQVFRASPESDLIKEASGKPSQANIRQQSALQTTLSFEKRSGILDSASKLLLPVLIESIEAEIGLINEKQSYCESSGLNSCNFVLCTYVGTTASLENKSLDQKRVQDVMDLRVKFITEAFQHLKKEYPKSLDISMKSMTYFGVDRFAAVILKAYGKQKPEIGEVCEKGDLEMV